MKMPVDLVRKMVDSIGGIDGGDPMSKKEIEAMHGDRKVYYPGEGYNAGRDGEWDYFNPPKMAKAMKSGGKVTRCRGDGCAQRGRTKGTFR